MNLLSIFSSAGRHTLSFSCLQTVFTKISSNGRVRNTFWSNFLSMFCFIIVGGASSLFFMLSTTSAPILKALYSPYLDHFSLDEVNTVASVAESVCALLGLIFIYKFMPSQKVSLGNAVRACCLFLFFFLVGRVLLIKPDTATYRSMNEGVYGGFIGFIMIMVSIYYLSNAFLFSAQYAIYLEESERQMALARRHK